MSEGKELFRDRKRSHFVVRYDAILTVILASAVAFCLGMAAQWQITAATTLPACQTEDSTACYWDADTMGNGMGQDVVTPTDDPWNGVPECTDAIAEAGGICHGEP